MLKLNFRYHDQCNMCAAAGTSLKNIGLRLNKSQGFKPSAKNGVAVTVTKCKSCGLVFANPQPLPISFNDQYGLSAEEYWSESSFTWDVTHFGAEIDILKQLDFPFQGAKALDIGAGIGRTMLSLKAAGCDVYGFEPAADFYKLAIDKFGLSTDRLTLNTLEDATYPEKFFDFVTFGAVLEHLHDPNQSLKTALNWLKPGGLIHIEVPSSRWLIGKLYNMYYKFFCWSSFVTNISPLHSPYHHFEFNIKAFQKNGVANGYDVVYHKIEVCETTMPVKYFDGLLKSIMRITGSGMQLVVFLKKKA